MIDISDFDAFGDLSRYPVQGFIGISSGVALPRHSNIFKRRRNRSYFSAANFAIMVQQVILVECLLRQPQLLLDFRLISSTPFALQDEAA